MHPLDALGSPTRRAILAELRSRPLSVVELAARFPVSRPAISRHLRTLEDAGLVTFNAAGNRNLYTLRPEGLLPVQEFIASFWDDALENLQRLSRE